MAATLAATLAPPPASAAPDDGITRLRIVGGLAAPHQYTRHEEPFWLRTLPAVSNGKLQAEIVPFDRAGIRGQDMLRLMQAGVVPFGSVQLGLAATEDALVGAPDLAGLNPDFAAMRRTLAAFRPALARHLREQFGIELLAVYAYPAQAIFCRKAFAGLADLAGRRVRVSSSTQADLVEALGATPVYTAFSDIVPQVQAGALDCAITGTMSGNTIGLHEVTTHLSPLAISWGLTAFAANGTAWRALPPAHRGLIAQKLPPLEDAIWVEAEHETGEGVACNTGGSGCVGGRAGHMTLVPPNRSDLDRLHELTARVVLPRWVQRCGPRCVGLWNGTLAPVLGMPVAGASAPPAQRH